MPFERPDMAARQGEGVDLISAKHHEIPLCRRDRGAANRYDALPHALQLMFVGDIGRARQLLPYLGKLFRTHLPFLLR